MRVQYQRWQHKVGRQQDFDWENWSARSGQAAHVQYANPEDLEDPFRSKSPYSDFFNNIFGQVRGRCRGGGRATTPNPRRGREVEYEVDLHLEESYHSADRLDE